MSREPSKEELQAEIDRLKREVEELKGKLETLQREGGIVTGDDLKEYLRCCGVTPPPTHR
ncbi:hypothetical protein CKO28_10835 [Rhodovibrio sodomensis]|uniref:Uncharacterized protein n=1 Tax=Rhodovibrio sodomensis TaxID=1088 RepID=A0ABS1DF19_9PROT|nr:hypothetical protein [Rhodovibrio sodomensis]MBK1668527.1 hypothetical protein [Rhodovibrio sodomensis]